jgi:bacterioferritin-associated ferredoxin
MDLDHKLCYCYHVSKRKIVNFVKQTQPERASQISECFGAGSGCGWCIPFLVRIHEQVLSGQDSQDELTPQEYEALRAQYREGVAAGDCDRNSYAAVSARQASSSPSPSSKPTAKSRTAEEPLDYTRYFSRSRPDPEPETLQGEPPTEGR